MNNFLISSLLIVVNFICYGQEKDGLDGVKSQLFDLDTISYTQVKGANGTEINFAREDFEVGMNEKLTLELKEQINSSHFIFIELTADGQKVNLKNNRRIPVNVPGKKSRQSKIYFSKLNQKDKTEWTKLPLYSGVMSFDQQWNIDVLKAVRSDSLDYYKYTDIDGNEHESILYTFMIDRLGWFKFD